MHTNGKSGESGQKLKSMWLKIDNERREDEEKKERAGKNEWLLSDI